MLDLELGLGGLWVALDFFFRHACLFEVLVKEGDLGLCFSKPKNCIVSERPGKISSESLKMRVSESSD